MKSKYPKVDREDAREGPETGKPDAEDRREGAEPPSLQGRKLKPENTRPIVPNSQANAPQKMKPDTSAPSLPITDKNFKPGNAPAQKMPPGRLLSVLKFAAAKKKAMGNVGLE